MTINLAWWCIPVALVLAGALVGCWRMSRYEHSDWLDVRSLVFIFWFAMFCAAAVAFVGGHVLAS